jgi:glutathione S-transferase
MTDVILHHYPLSPFAEKIRRLLAYKRVPWRSVEQPMMAPKPDLTALTGGNRRIPVLQIGADVYCDSACIARRLDALHPEPTCLPPDQAGLIGMIEDWADHRFTGQVMPSVIVELLPRLPPDILIDRAAMSPMLSKEMLFAAAPHTRTQALLSIDQLDARLRDRTFLVGDGFTLADAACFQPLWFMRNSPAQFQAVTERPALTTWYGRIDAFGTGASRPMAPAEALAIAREAAPVDIGGPSVADPTLAVGDVVGIVADDFGREESRGTVARVTADEITIRRQDRALGEIAVHFPRSGYRIVARS